MAGARIDDILGHLHDYLSWASHCLLRQAAPLIALPRANVVLTIVFGVIGALSPLLTIALQTIGASLTFICGAIVLVIGATALYRSAPTSSLFITPEQPTSVISPIFSGLIFSIGLGAGLEINLLLRVFPSVSQAQLSGISAEMIISGLLLVSAVMAVPMAEVTTKLGSGSAFQLSLAVMTGCTALILLDLNPVLTIGLILLGGTALGLVFISQIPLILERVPSDRAGLGTGLYFGGLGAATAVLSILLLGRSGLSPLSELLWMLAAFVEVVVSLWASRRFTESTSQ